MANAQDLISFAMAAVNRQPPLKYGQRAINGLPQRGPNSYDCIGFYRWCVLSIAPELWGPIDCWIVGCYYSQSQGKYSIDNGPALPGDALIWIDKSGVPQHIGIADGLGNVISALNTVKNICIVPIKSVGYPTLKVIHTGLQQAEKDMYIDPTVLVDTRTSAGQPSLQGYKARAILVRGKASIPDTATGVKGILTVTNQTALGYLTIGAVVTDKPTWSNLNFPLADNRATFFSCAIAKDGTITVTYSPNSANPETCDVIVTLTEYTI